MRSAKKVSTSERNNPSSNTVRKVNRTQNRDFDNHNGLNSTITSSHTHVYNISQSESKIARLIEMFSEILQEETTLEPHEKKLILDLLKNWLASRTQESKSDLFYTLGVIERKNENFQSGGLKHTLNQLNMSTEKRTNQSLMSEVTTKR